MSRRETFMHQDIIGNANRLRSTLINGFALKKGIDSLYALVISGSVNPTRTSRNWKLKIEDWRFVVRLDSTELFAGRRSYFILSPPSKQL